MYDQVSLLGNLNFIRQCIGEWVGSIKLFTTRIWYIIHPTIVYLFSIVLDTIIHNHAFINHNLRSDWFEGMLETVRLMVAMPSWLTGSGEREREREPISYQLPYHHTSCVHVHLTVLFCHATLEYSDGDNQNNDSKLARRIRTEYTVHSTQE